MTVQNDVVWSKIQMPVQADSGNSGNSGASEEDPVPSPEQAIKPETAPKTSAPTGVTGVEETAADRLATSKVRLRATWTPPDIYRLNRPSLLQVIAYAWEGEWGPKTGPWRLAGKIDAILFGIPLVALFYSLAWIAERPSRRFCAALLLSAVAWWLNGIWWF
jgi:hypothetical protein